MVVTAGAAVLAGWVGGARHAPLPRGVLVITLDTTRADRLSPYGFMNISLPHLERLAREGVVFDRAMSPAPLTLPSHTSLFTGLLPPHHGVHDNADPPLAAIHTTLAEALRARGFRTGAFVGSVVVGPDRGLRQGFEEYRGVDGSEGRDRERPADRITADAVRWLSAIGDSRFFLWVHFYDPHAPYDPPEPYASIYAHDPYLGEIASVDAQIGRLLAALDARALLDRTIVVVAGDHGESLGEHGEPEHGVFLYENVLRVPLMIRAPGVAPVRVGEIVRLTDVMPTLLPLVGLPVPRADGVNLGDLIRGRRKGLNLEAYAETWYPARLGWSALHALRDGRFKLVAAPRPELYDLERDPFEEHNIYFNGERRALTAAMTGRLAAIAGEGGPPPPLAGRQEITSELLAQLGALGYVGTPAARNRPDWANLPDPKDCIGSAVRADHPARGRRFAADTGPPDAHASGRDPEMHCVGPAALLR